MSTNESPFAKYMAYLHVMDMGTNDFRILERLVNDEFTMYNAALEEAYALKSIFNIKKREKAVATLDETHKEFIKKANEAIDNYVRNYEKTREEWHKIQPNYQWDMSNSTHNKEEFNRFCSEFANKFGPWFWDIQLRHDPLDDMNYGYATIGALQNYENDNWYPHMEHWKCLPYGARLLMYYLGGYPDWHGDSCWIDLTFKIMFHRGLYTVKPSNELLKAIQYKSK